MEDATKIGLGVVLGVFVAIFAAACLCLIGVAGWASVASLAMSSQTPFYEPGYTDCGGFPTVTANAVTLDPGEAAEANGIEVRVLDYDFSRGYEDPYEYYEAPPEDAIFLWLELKVSNTNDYPAYAAGQETFAVIADGIQYESVYYAERPGYPAYYSGEIFPQAAKLGWIRFTVPEGMSADDMHVGYMPYDEGARTVYRWELAPIGE